MYLFIKNYIIVQYKNIKNKQIQKIKNQWIRTVRLKQNIIVRMLAILNYGWIKITELITHDKQNYFIN